MLTLLAGLLGASAFFGERTARRPRNGSVAVRWAGLTGGSSNLPLRLCTMRARRGPPFELKELCRHPGYFESRDRTKRPIQPIRGERRAICPAVSPPRSRLGWIRITQWQKSHFTVPSSSMTVLLDRPQFRQCQFRTTSFIDPRFLAEGRRRARAVLAGGGRRGDRKNQLTTRWPLRA
jgi:hypothetical protein